MAISNLISLFFPELCEACGTILSDGEDLICTACRHDLPVTNFHFNNEETVKKVLYGRLKLENATALFHFNKKSGVQQLLHNLKYRGHEQIGEALGLWLGAELKTIEAYQQVDVVVPVPLYKLKLRQRGYNQVTKFGKAIANVLDADFNDSILIKTKSTATQVFKDRLKRFYKDNAVFEAQNYEQLKGRHILLVDDIITTGATMESCANQLFKIPNIKLSIATMAIADLI